MVRASPDEEGVRAASSGASLDTTDLAAVPTGLCSAARWIRRESR